VAPLFLAHHIFRYTIHTNAAERKRLDTARELNWPATMRPSYTTRSLVTRVGVATWLAAAKLGREKPVQLCNRVSLGRLVLDVSDHMSLYFDAAVNAGVRGLEFTPRSLTLSLIPVNLFPTSSGSWGDFITWTTLKIHSWLIDWVQFSSCAVKSPKFETLRQQFVYYIQPRLLSL